MRVDKMFEMGLVSEVENLRKQGYTKDLVSMQGIGYKEIFDYLDGMYDEEMARYMFVWLVYFSVSYTARREKHIRIDAAINLYPKKARPYIEILSELIVLGFAIFIAVTGYTVFGKIAWSGQMSPAMRIPMQFVYAAPMIGMGLTAIRQLQCIYRRIKALKNHEEVTEA